MKPRRQADGLTRAASGKWRLRVMVGGDRHQVSLETKAEAEDIRHALRARRVALRLGLQPPGSVDRQTLGAVLDAYATECEALGRSKAHLSSIAGARKLLVRWRGEAGEAELRRQDLVDFVAWCRRETASRGRMIHNALVILRTALRRSDLPVPAMPRLELPARVPKTLSRAELRRLLEQLTLGTACRTAIEIGLRTGARGSEIRRIQIGDIDLKRWTLLLRRAKGRPGRRGSEEVVPVSPGLARALAAYVAKLPAGLEPSALLLGSASPRRTLETACRAAGVPVRTTIGWTRAQAATMAREAGMSLGLVSGTLGHVGTKMTREHYDESSREAAERWTARTQAGKVLDKVMNMGRTGGKKRQPAPKLRPLSSPAIRAKSLKTQAGP